VNELVRIAMPVRKMLKKNNGGMFEYLLRNHKSIVTNYVDLTEGHPKNIPSKILFK
jgi:hypothetical protein